MGLKRSKWSGKVVKCKESSTTKWILTTHLKKVHEFIAKKGNHGCPSTHEKGPPHQNHLVTNVHILRDV
jgi:hypothetical protein